MKQKKYTRCVAVLKRANASESATNKVKIVIEL